jgi:hypothetical protein
MVHFQLKKQVGNACDSTDLMLLTSRETLSFPGTLVFDSLNRPAEPGSERLLEFELRAPMSVVIHRLSHCCEWNEPARQVFTLSFFRNKLKEETLTARVWARGIVKIEADGRILERARGSPWSTLGAPVTAILQELQLAVQRFQDITVILTHMSTSC